MASFDINNVGVEMEYAQDVFSQHQMKSMSESLFVHFRAASMMLRYVVGCHATLWDVTLHCGMLRYVVDAVGCSATLWDVTLHCGMLRHVVGCYATFFIYPVMINLI